MMVDIRHIPANTCCADCLTRDSSANPLGGVIRAEGNSLTQPGKHPAVLLQSGVQSIYPTAKPIR